MATRRLLTLKRLRSGQRTRPAQTPGPSPVGLSQDGVGSTPAGPGSAAEYQKPTMAILNSAAARCGAMADRRWRAGSLARPESVWRTTTPRVCLRACACSCVCVYVWVGVCEDETQAETFNYFSVVHGTELPGLE